MANPSRFYSAALEAIQAIKQQRATGQQLKSMMLAGGAKQRELDYIGVSDFLKDDKPYRTAGVADYIDRHQIKPHEVVNKGKGAGEEQDSLIQNAVEAAVSGDEDAYRTLTGEGFSDNVRRLNREYNRRGVSQSRMDSIWDEITASLPDGLFEGEPGDTKWGEYVSRPASDAYTEHLVTLPEGSLGQEPSPQGDYRDIIYSSPHWDHENVLAHMRYDFDPDALRLEELQSDWLQQGRAKGFRLEGPELSDLLRQIDEQDARYLSLVNEARNKYGDVSSMHWPAATNSALTFENNKTVDLRNKLSGNRFLPPKAPLANVNDWTAMLMRRAMLEAALKDKAKLRLTTGAMQDARYSPEPGRAQYYDKIIPNIANKILKPWGGKVKPAYNYDSPAMGDNMATADDEYHSIDLPRELMDALQKKGAVPFFRKGGRV